MIDPKLMLFSRENALVAIYTLFSDNKCPLLAQLRGEGRRKGTMSPFFCRFSYSEASLTGNVSLVDRHGMVHITNRFYIF